MRTKRAFQRGFTLIEVILGIAILGFIATGIYAIATRTVELSAEVSKSQQQEIMVHNFLRLCRRNFEDLPGNAGVTLSFHNNGRFQETDVVFWNYPLAFHWPSVPAGSSRVVLLSKANSRGSMDVVLLYLDQTHPPDEDYRALMNSGRLQGATILPLLTDVTRFDWFFLDETLSERGELVKEWPDATRRPSLVEMMLQFYGSSKEQYIRSVFWIPPMVNPEQFFQSNRQGGNVGNGGVGGVPGGGEPPPGGGPGGPPPGGGQGGPGRGGAGGAPRAGGGPGR